jgi:hypothetical protein
MAMKNTHSMKSMVTGKTMLLLPAFAACFMAQRLFGADVNKQHAAEAQGREVKNARTSGQDTRKGLFPTPIADKDTMERFVRQLRAAKTMEERRRIIRAMKEWRRNHIAPVFRYDLKNEHIEDHALPLVKDPRRMKALHSKVLSTETAYHVPFASAGNRIDLFIEGSEVGFSKEARITSVSAPAWIHWTGNGQTVESRDTAAGLAVIRFDFSVDRTAPVGKEMEAILAFSVPTGEYLEKKLKIIVDPPGRFELFQNYPNPFNPTTTVSFVISYPSFVTLGVYDVLGREVATLVNEMRQPGEYSVKWDAGQMPSGVYFYCLRAGTFTETKKLVLMR